MQLINGSLNVFQIKKKKRKERGGETCSLICQKSCCTNFGIQFLPSDCVLFIDFLLDDQNVI